MSATPIGLRVAALVESLAVSWQVSTTEKLDGFLVHYRPKGTSTWATVALAATVRSYVISGLQAESYEIQVRALVAGGIMSATGTPEQKPVQPPSSSETFGGYTAANPMPAGRVPYAASSPFNSPVPSNPTILTNSEAMVKFSLGSEVENLATGGGFATYYFTSEHDPLVELKVKGVGASLNGRTIRCPKGVVPAPGSDAHLCLIQPDGTAYDFWQTSVGTDALSANGAGVSNIVTGSGVCDTGGGNAAGFGLLAGVIRAQELIAGSIPHALVATIASTRNGFVAPAIHTDGTSSSSNAPYEGQRLYLAVSDAAIAGLKLPSWKAAIVTAAAHYGIYVCDSGGAGMGIKLESSSQYPAMGVPDPLFAFAKAQGLPTWEGRYVFHLNEGVPWTLLRAIAPST